MSDRDELIKIIEDAIQDFEEIGDFDSEYNRIPGEYRKRLNNLQAARTQTGNGGAVVPEGWKLVPVEPTEAMIEAASDAYMPFGDMDLAIRCAILAAPQPPVDQEGKGDE